ncbi:MAG: hypothetical protein NVSMB17_03190 [Candidatus Dormibacteria bacterium]
MSSSPQSPLALAIRDIRAAVVPAAQPDPGPTPRTLLKQMDRFIDELERLHLKGGIRVPSTTAVRLSGFLESLPVECQSEFALRTRIVYVLEDLFEVQDCLLNLKVPGRDQLSAADNERDGGEGVRRRTGGPGSRVR